MAHARPARGASRDDIRASVLQALQDLELTWTPSQIDAAVGALAGGLGHFALVIPRIVARTALLGWNQRRNARGARSAADPDPPSEST